MAIWVTNETPEGQVLETCSILTTASNSLMAPLHDRMPVILHQGEFDRWLDPAETVPQAIQHFYQPYPSELMQEWPVSSLVNSPRNDLKCVSDVCLWVDLSALIADSERVRISLEELGKECMGSLDSTLITLIKTILIIRHSSTSEE